MSDNVNHPQHYQAGNIECIDVLIDLGIAKDFCRGNAIKYLWRCERKNGLEDLKKAQWYLNKLIELEEKEQTFEQTEGFATVDPWVTEDEAKEEFYSDSEAYPEIETWDINDRFPKVVDTLGRPLTFKDGKWCIENVEMNG